MQVLGRVPGAVSSLVPGRCVGFMPQELALYEEFTAHQNFLFYGQLFGMSDAQIRERETFLLSFLHLPPSTRPIKQLSGGQQRRVSLACALLHSPPLLLLDEPTVGVDPVLRARIWSHLRTLSAQGSTIVITTHYIDEARQADYVGFMRGGKILQEGRPDDIIAQHGCESLEQVFLQLCRRAEEENDDDAKGEEQSVQEDAQADEQRQQQPQQTRRRTAAVEAKAEERTGDGAWVNGSLSGSTSDASLLPSSPLNSGVEEAQSAPPLSSLLSSYLPRWSFLLACMWRNLTRFRLNIPALLFVFLLPSVQVILFCIAIGKDPQGIALGLVNHDRGGNYSEAFASALTAERLVVWPFDSEAEALHAAKLNEVWGYALIPTNYSRNLDGLFHDPFSNPYGDGCIIRYAIDASDEQIAVFITTAILQAYRDTLNGVLPANLSHNYPLQQLPPVYGTSASSFTDFVAPVRSSTPSAPQLPSARPLRLCLSPSLRVRCACVRCVGHHHHHRVQSVDRADCADAGGGQEERSAGPRVERWHPSGRDDAQPCADAAGHPQRADRPAALLRTRRLPPAHGGLPTPRIHRHSPPGVLRHAGQRLTTLIGHSARVTAPHSPPLCAPACSTDWSSPRCAQRRDRRCSSLWAPSSRPSCSAEWYATPLRHSLAQHSRPAPPHRLLCCVRRWCADLAAAGHPVGAALVELGAAHHVGCGSGEGCDEPRVGTGVRRGVARLAHHLRVGRAAVPVRSLSHADTDRLRYNASPLATSAAALLNASEEGEHL